MDQIYSELIKYNHPLEHWYYGHFHESATSHIDNVIFKMLEIEEMCELHREWIPYLNLNCHEERRQDQDHPHG